MYRAAVYVVCASLSASAPFQCSHEPDPTLAREDSPGEALYKLAVGFRDSGKREAWLETLRYIVARYPSSRWAATASDDLRQAGEADAGAAVP
ncbi:MAG: hypothetical protein IT373_02900 [Polyangiaceae bacterium]|nr:hypothetical protein [Polyangiaceae bacterium]